MKKIKSFIFLVLLAGVFAGCSSKTQIAPNGEDYEVSHIETEFREKKELNAKIKAAYSSGHGAGYAEAKAEFEKIIPYIEAIRASAELKNSGGLCLPPLFLDKSNPSRVAVVVGEAHVCQNFTVDNVLAAVKSGIPGMPQSKGASAVTGTDRVSGGVSSISLAGVDAKDFFIESVGKVEQRVKANIADTFTNREILRNSNFKYSKSEVGDNNELAIEFESEVVMRDFCSRYSICKNSQSGAGATK
ncbi:MAG: hypothetical protein PHO62_07760 [Sulfurimonas sp.]|uniref:hypothetical protein n=1 Tax=Sulfurimonas sp. TaxID=2022749 RepID=UPI0026177F80|nr:hypothetical protein [Sulfurimonas sp.]MDD5373302.1 hypothetical protein [Sulfurimonas sp.]